MRNFGTQESLFMSEKKTKRKRKQLLLLGVKNVIKLVLHHAGVHAHNVGSFMVKIPVVETQRKNTISENRFTTTAFATLFFFPGPLHCLLLQLHALDALHVAHSGVDCRVVYGLDGGFDSVHGPLLLLRHLSLSGHAEAFCVWRLERGQRLTSAQRRA